MITFEILLDSHVFERPQTTSLAYEVDQDKRSDRDPSLWQSRIIAKAKGPLLHLFDQEFANSKGPRWLYKDVTTRDWCRFKFRESFEGDFFKLIDEGLKSSPTGIWLLSDAQYGPKPMVYLPKTIRQFESLYCRVGIRLNCAVPIVAPRSA